MSAQISDLLKQDFGSLSTNEVELLMDEADRMNFQLPDHANGSRARYFHAKLQQRQQKVLGTRQKDRMKGRFAK